MNNTMTVKDYISAQVARTTEASVNRKTSLADQLHDRLSFTASQVGDMIWGEEEAGAWAMALTKWVDVAKGDREEQHVVNDIYNHLVRKSYLLSPESETDPIRRVVLRYRREAYITVATNLFNAFNSGG